MRALAVAVLLVLLAGVGLAAIELASRSGDGKPPAPPLRALPQAEIGGAPTRAAIDAAIRRGVDYLLTTQHASGSWGTTASNLWDIYAPVPGSFITFEVAVTALDVSALLEAGGDEPRVTDAIRRGTDFLLKNHEHCKRITADVLYNVWASAYALECFARLLGREQDPTRRAALVAACDKDVDLLARFEFVDGGWGYYNFDIVAQRPEHGATSFTTATVLLAMRRAVDQGIHVPARLVRRALDLVEVCRKPDWAFAYSWDHRYYPQGRINKTQGSLARSPACAGALARWGEKAPVSALVGTLDDLDQFGAYLRIARKYPFPHESWFQNSGYFCFYGYYYAAELFDLVPADARKRHAASIAKALLPLQEQDGSWWDYQLYNYHKPYGTGYVLTALAHCRSKLP